jgi:CRISPR/Cas system-associated exonuclease Cas4 (RecB family)
VKLDHLSASRIKTYDLCPLKYHAIYDLGIPDESGPAADMGSAVHRAMENCVNLSKVGIDLSKEQMLEKLAEACAEFRVKGADEETAAELFDNGVRWGYLRNLKRCLGCEVKFDFALPDGTKVTGRMDKIDVIADTGCAQVHDLKTQKRMMDESTLKSDWQSVVYNLAARNISVVTGDVTISFWVLRHQVQRVIMSAEDAAMGRELLMAKAQTIRACSSPKSKPSKLCPYCPYYAQCEDGKSWIARAN